MSKLVSKNVRGGHKREREREREFETGEEVLVLLPTTSNKLFAQWQGPYRMLHRVGEANYEVHMPHKRKRKTIFHVNMLKRWYQPEATCMWAAEVDPEEEEDVPSWRGERGESSSVGTQLTEQQEQQLFELLSEFKSVISGECGRTSICQHHIQTVGGLKCVNIHTVYLKCIKRQWRKRLR